MEYLQETPIFKKINALPHEQRRRVINDQGLNGFFNEESKRFQKLSNFHKLSLAKEVGQALEEKGIKHAFLKGVTFLGDLYPAMGERFMSDVDIYVASSNQELVTEILLCIGFKKRPGETWLGNKHKEEWIHSGSQVVLEVHYKLFWHIEDPDELNVCKRNEIYQLEDELHFVYLCGHYAFQHTCQKLYWLIDLYLFLKMRKLDFERVDMYASALSLKKSVYFSAKIIRYAFNFDFDLAKGRISIPINENLLISDRLDLYYLFLKWSLKDHWWDNFRYSSTWLKNLLSKG